ncbi:MAG: thiamine pyrophosphate-binding protein [Gammaproteobacteria bacterium]|nr:thiamine pyrophosphate-binding protein [Gammaproteobacteria bacterium]
MRGRQVFMDSLMAHGVEAIFGNPGTTENPLLDSLADYPGIRYYTALHEGIAVGAAKGYAQASGKAAVVNLHVAPGLGNGIGMIYGALKGRTPMIVTAGQQDTRLRLREPLLSHDLVAMAAPVTKWSAEPRSADEMAATLRRGFRIASEAPAGPVFIALPVDVMEQETELGAEAPDGLHAHPQAKDSGVAAAVAALLGSSSPAIIAGDDVATAGAHGELAALAERLGAPVWHEPLRSHAAFPSRHPNNQGRIPFEAATIRKALAGHDLVLLVGANLIEELWFDPGPLLPEAATVVHLCESPSRLAFNHRADIGLVGDLRDAMQRITTQCAELGGEAARALAQARNEALISAQQVRREAAAKAMSKIEDVRPMTPRRALHEISNTLPREAVVVDESITGSLEVATLFDFRGPGDYFSGRGGGIGQGIAAALGVQVAQRDRPVVALSGDGSAMYSVQALWTAAHCHLPVIFVILSNREYRVLKLNLEAYRHRFNAESNRPYPHMDLANPTLGFVDMARGMGMEGEQVSEPEALTAALRRALAAGKPYLIDVIVSGTQ